MYDTQEMLPFPIHVGLHDQFQEERFEVRRPVLLCNPVAKSHGDIVFPIKNKEAHLMCFGARPRDGEPVQKLARTLNQFGPELLRLRKMDSVHSLTLAHMPLGQLVPKSQV